MSEQNPFKIELDLPPEPPKAAPPLPPPPPIAQTFAVFDTQEQIPFEDEAGSFTDRVLATLKLGFTDPFGFAERIPTSERILAPWIFFLTLQLPFTILKLTVETALHEALVSFARTSGVFPPGQSMPAFLSPGVMLGLTLASLPVIFFVFSASVHLCLWVMGGTGSGMGLRQTLRTVGYGSALAAPLTWIPLVGGLAWMVFLVMLGLGLARVHRTESWRGVCAAFQLPFVGCVCLLLVFQMALGGALMC